MIDTGTSGAVDTTSCSMKSARTLGCYWLASQAFRPPGRDEVRLARGEMAEVRWVVEVATPAVHVRRLSALASAAGSRCPSGS
jgi:hypothetical protein